VSDSGVYASPHSVMLNEGDIVEKLAELGDQLEVDTWVVGLARRPKSTGGEQKFRDFADQLRQRTCKPVVLWDESLSTVEAWERLRAAGRKRRSSQDEIDMHAAAVILQSYLDEQSRLAAEVKP
jgi:putative transcription antitermination factor YqgF